MHDHIFRAADRLERFADQVFARLHQHLNGHIVGNMPAFDQLAADFVFGFGGRGKAHFDFFEAHVAKRFEIIQLFLQVHRRYQRLVAVAQVHTAPDRGFFDHPARPLPVGQIDLLKGYILLVTGIHTNILLVNVDPAVAVSAKNTKSARPAKGRAQNARGTTLIRTAAAAPLWRASNKAPVGNATKRLALDHSGFKQATPG